MRNPKNSNGFSLVFLLVIVVQDLNSDDFCVPRHNLVMLATPLFGWYRRIKGMEREMRKKSGN